MACCFRRRSSLSASSMLPRERVIAKLRELGFHFKRDSWRVSLYKRGVERVEVPKRDLIDADWVRSTFRRLAMSREEVERFIGQCKN